MEKEINERDVEVKREEIDEGGVWSVEKLTAETSKGYITLTNGKLLMETCQRTRLRNFSMNLFDK